MAMNKTILGNNIVTALKVINPSISGAGEAQLQVFWQAIADEIIKHLIAQMQVNTTTTLPGVQVGTSTLNGTGVSSTIS